MVIALDKPINDIDIGFENFRHDELESWRTSRLEALPLPEFLIKLSGSFTSPISHRLNQPSFSTDFAENGETADPTNGCIAMKKGTAFEQNTFVYDQVHRRDKISHVSTKYPPFVRAAHKKWTMQISESLEAKMEVIYGKKAMQPLITDPKVQITPLPLWGDYTGVILYLLHEDNFDNAQEGYTFRRIALSAYHPQRLFYDTANGPFVTLQEKVVAAAATMAGINHIPGYYVNRLWATVIPSRKQRRLEAILIRRHAQIDILIESFTGSVSYTDLDAQTFNDDNEQDGSWEFFFDPISHSNRRLMELIPEAIKEAENDVSDWTDPPSFPKLVKEWWRGQKQPLFHDFPVSGLEDVVITFDRCEQAAPIPGLGESIDKSSLRQVILGLLVLEKCVLESRKASASSVADLVHYRFDGQPVALQCSGCGRRAGDVHRALFSVNRPNHLFTNRTEICPNCQSWKMLHPIHHLAISDFGSKTKGQSW